MDTNT